MKNQKYEFTGETKKEEGHTLHRIRAVRDFGDVKAGDLGGWIESNWNLSHKGEAWVGEEAMVYKNARIYDDARVSGQSVIRDSNVLRRARIAGNAKIVNNSHISGGAKVFGNAVISDWSMVDGMAVISEQAGISNSYVSGYARIRGRAVVRAASVCGYASVSGDAVIQGPADIGNDADIRCRGEFVSLIISPMVGVNIPVAAFRCENDKVLISARTLPDDLTWHFSGEPYDFLRRIREIYPEYEVWTASEKAVSFAETNIRLCAASFKNPAKS